MDVDPRATVDEILEFLSGAGEFEYHGERVSQLEHALQCAHLAQLNSGSEEEVIAALLHDIGHIWPVEEREVTSVGVVQHDAIGARVLRGLGFSEAVADIVGGHVLAKRYLVATDGKYASQLSDASVESLRLQGGPMSTAEVEAFSMGRPTAVEQSACELGMTVPKPPVPRSPAWRVTGHFSRIIWPGREPERHRNPGQVFFDPRTARVAFSSSVQAQCPRQQGNCVLTESSPHSRHSRESEIPGILGPCCRSGSKGEWIPAFAGMTIWRASIWQA